MNTQVWFLPSGAYILREQTKIKQLQIVVTRKEINTRQRGSLTRSFKSARMMLKIHLFWPWHQKHTNSMPFQPCYFNSGTCLHPSQSPSLVEIMSAFLFVNADMILSLKIKCERKIVARRRRTHRQ